MYVYAHVYLEEQCRIFLIPLNQYSKKVFVTWSLFSQITRAVLWERAVLPGRDQLLPQSASLLSRQPHVLPRQWRLLSCTCALLREVLLRGRASLLS